jgi:hypothetical protein
MYLHTPACVPQAAVKVLSISHEPRYFLYTLLCVGFCYFRNIKFFKLILPQGISFSLITDGGAVLLYTETL